MIGKDVPVVIVKKNPKKKPRLTVESTKYSPMRIDGYKGLGVGDKVRVMITGEVVAVGERWEDVNKSVTLAVSQCQIENPAKKKVSLDEAVKSAQKKISGV